MSWTDGKRKGIEFEVVEENIPRFKLSKRK